MLKSQIYFTERTAGGWVLVAGVIGFRRYLYYTITEAKKRYREEVKKNLFYNKRG